MDKILEDSGALTPALLLADEGQFEQKALDLLSSLSKLSSQDTAVRDHLDVCPMKECITTETDLHHRRSNHPFIRSPSSICC